MTIFATQSRKLWSVVILGMVACASGICYAVLIGEAADGGRGGAVAVAFAFAALFTSTPAIPELIEAPDHSGMPAFETLPIDRQIARLRTAVAEMQDRQRYENRFLVLRNVVRTLVWAFGDIVAHWLGAAA